MLCIYRDSRSQRALGLELGGIGIWGRSTLWKLMGRKVLTVFELGLHRQGG